MPLEDRRRRLDARLREEARGRPETPLRTLLSPLVRDQRRRLVLLSIVSIGGGLAEAAVLVLVARVAVAIASDQSSVRFDVGPVAQQRFGVGTLVGAAAALVVVRMALSAAQTVLAARAQYSTIGALRTSMIRRYLAAAWSLQAEQREGRIQELATTYANTAASTIATLSQGAIAGFNLAALLAIALVVSPLASVAAGGAALLVGLVLRPLRRTVRQRSARSAAANLEFATGLTEMTSTLQEVRVFQVEERVGERLAALTDEYAHRALQTAYMSGAISVLYQGLAMLILVGALAVVYDVGISQLTAMGAVVLIMLRSLTYAQAVQLSFQTLHQSAPFLETLHDEMRRYGAAALPRDGRPLDRIGDLAFDDVSFGYEAGVPVLRNLSFVIPHGEVIGVVGPSGAGKSTMVQLLLRLRDPVAGAVRADGVDVRELAVDDWYRRVTFVPQEARLFAGTVAANIRFFRDDVDDSAIERAAKLAHLHEEISAWPLGYDTPVGERGSQLSGGQRQRLCIARALVDDPDVLVLDEPTSSLDIRSDALIREALAELAPDVTVIVIAHRLSTLSICDRIMVIFDGRLQGFDEPARLEATDPFYAEALRLSGMR